MLAFYLFALIIGGGLLLFSAASVGGAEAGEADAAHGGLHGESDPTAAHEFFSVRVLLYFLAGFGATGLLLEAFIGAPRGASLAWAIATGLVAATAAAVVYGWLRRSESGLVSLTSDHLVGLPARVVVPVGAEHRGKIAAVHDGREIELLARLFTTEDGACPRGSLVVIVEIDGDTALVTPVPLLPSELT